MAEHSWPRAVDLLFDLVACELFWVVDEQTDDLCVVVAFVPKFEREVVVAPNLFRNRTELGEADAETGQPACAVAHLLPVRLPPRVAVLLEQVEDLGLCHGTSLLSTDPRQRATWQGSRTMAGAKEHFPRWQPWVLWADVGDWRAGLQQQRWVRVPKVVDADLTHVGFGQQTPRSRYGSTLIGCPMCRAASIGSTRYNRTQPPRNRRRFRRRIDRA